jgi:hypothetical protein
MNAAERLVLTATRIIVSYRIGRWILIGYLGTLHFLVFFSMYIVASSDHSKHQLDFERDAIKP